MHQSVTEPTVFDDHFEGHPAGHNVAGTFYLLWGLWWLFMTYWTYFTEPRRQLSKQTGIMSFFSHESDDPLSYKSWFPLPCCSRIPIESICKIVFPGLGIFVEMCLDFYPDKTGKVTFQFIPYKLPYDTLHRHFIHLDRLFHISLYLAFLISGVVDLITVCTKLPRLTNKIFLCFAFYIEYLLFSFHIHGRNVFNSAVHELLLYFIGACAVFATLRLFTSRNLFINAFLSGSMILQGANLCQAGWILYGGIKWSPFSHENPKFMAALTTWHLLATGLFMIIVFIIMRAILRRMGKLRNSEYQRLPMNVDDLSEKIELMECSHEDSIDAFETHDQV